MNLLKFIDSSKELDVKWHYLNIKAKAYVITICSKGIGNSNFPTSIKHLRDIPLKTSLWQLRTILWHSNILPSQTIFMSLNSFP